MRQEMRAIVEQQQQQQSCQKHATKDVVMF